MVNQQFPWLVEGVIAQGHTSLVIGRPHRGKSWMAAAMAVSIAGGTQCLGRFPTRQASVIYVDGDSPTSILEWRLARLCRSAGLSRQDLPLFVWSMTGFRLDAAADLRNLLQTIQGLPPPVLVIIDCLDSVLGYLDTNRTSDAARIGQNLNEIRAVGATVLLVHHMSIKGVEDEVAWGGEKDFTRLAMGNTKIVACSDTVFGLWQLSQNPTVFLVRVKPRRLPLDIPERFALRLVEDPGKTNAALRYEQEPPVLPSDNAKTLAKFFILDPSENFTVKETMQGTGELLSVSELRATLKELAKNGVLKLWRETHNMYRYGVHPDFDSLDSDYAKALRG